MKIYKLPDQAGSFFRGNSEANIHGTAYHMKKEFDDNY